MSKWDELKAMRQANGEPADPPAGDQAAASDAAAAEAAHAAEAAAAATAAEVHAAERAAAEQATADAAAADALKSTPTSVEIDIDGQKIAVAPEIAAAFKQAEAIKVNADRAAEREQLAADVAERVKRDLTPPPKTEAELAAERALAEASRVKMPDAKLMLDNPDEYNKQMAAFVEQQNTLTREQTLAEVARTQAATTQQNKLSAELAARKVVRDRFYESFPSFKGSEAICDTVLEEKLQEILKSGRLSKGPLPLEEANALMNEAFADVATRATRKIVGVMHAGKKIAPPSTPPPTLVSGQPAKSPAPPKVETPAPREKFPKGSVSALLAARKAAKEQPAA
jgi:hypothetical protein